MISLDLSCLAYRYIFLCDRWLALEEDDGMVDRILPVAGLEDLVAFKQLFSANVRKKLSNEHLWFSVFSRPTKSSFTRAQRISCCMSLLFMTMITNAMWFKSDDNAKQSQALKVGPVSFTVQQVYWTTTICCIHSINSLSLVWITQTFLHFSSLFSSLWVLLVPWLYFLSTSSWLRSLKNVVQNKTQSYKNISTNQNEENGRTLPTVHRFGEALQCRVDGSGLRTT